MRNKWDCICSRVHIRLTCRKPVFQDLVVEGSIQYGIWQAFGVGLRRLKEKYNLPIDQRREVNFLTMWKIKKNKGHCRCMSMGVSQVSGRWADWSVRNLLLSSCLAPVQRSAVSPCHRVTQRSGILALPLTNPAHWASDKTLHCLRFLACKMKLVPALKNCGEDYMWS